jgi:hypothetical protein
MLNDPLFWMLVAASLGGLVTLAVGLMKHTSTNFGEFGNGVLAMATMIALIAAGWLYLFEGRTHPKVNVSASATVVGVPPTGWRPNHSMQSVLVQISVSIENRGEQGRWFNCAALDILGLQGAEDRTSPYPDDLAGISLLRILPGQPADPLWTRCVGPNGFEENRNRAELEEQNRRRGDSDSVNPPRISGRPESGARYRDFYMEPGERTTKTWEQFVPCSYNVVRVIFKLPKPDGTAEYETKILVPIADICRGQRLVAAYPVSRD